MGGQKCSPLNRDPIRHLSPSRVESLRAGCDLMGRLGGWRARGPRTSRALSVGVTQSVHQTVSVLEPRRGYVPLLAPVDDGVLHLGYRNPNRPPLRRFASAGRGATPPRPRRALAAGATATFDAGVS